MSRRFSRIRQAPRLQRAFTRYQAYQAASGNRPRVPRPASSSPGGNVKVQIVAFGRDGSDLIRVAVSKRASTIMASAIGGRGEAATPAAIVYGGFQPAKVTLFIKTGSVNATSEITGLEYQKRNGASYTHAFGAATATEREFEAAAALTTALVGTDVNRAVSFQPERLYQR